eukprot:2752790-Rhodomonas_salina.1
MIKQNILCTAPLQHSRLRRLRHPPSPSCPLPRPLPLLRSVKRGRIFPPLTDLAAMRSRLGSRAITRSDDVTT